MSLDPDFRKGVAALPSPIKGVNDPLQDLDPAKDGTRYQKFCHEFKARFKEYIWMTRADLGELMVLVESSYFFKLVEKVGAILAAKLNSHGVSKASDSLVEVWGASFIDHHFREEIAGNPSALSRKYGVPLQPGEEKALGEALKEAHPELELIHFYWSPPDCPSGFTCSATYLTRNDGGIRRTPKGEMAPHKVNEERGKLKAMGHDVPDPQPGL